MTAGRGPLGWLVLEGFVLVALAVDARVRVKQRRADQPAITAVSEVVPAADLSIAGGARHLRFPSLEEPGAAFADGPGLPDLDPAAAAVAPPVEVYSDIAAQRAPR